ncbi:hypothetical protein [Caballeronia grimmiae]|uniref:hypothetical protein n=1 Tax=Caballeronia grimmiae TaxID=1071679 RepID=UPI0038BB909E
MSMEHTPGPWTVARGSWSEDGNAQYELEGIKVVQAADAYLIAAAPDLLGFAELVLRGIESGHIKAKPFLDMNTLVGDSIPMRTIGDAAREVIAKATGEKA